MKSCLNRKNFIVVGVCTVMLCLAAGMANGKTITVRADGTGDYPTIQEAIDDSNDGDIIEVQPGTYTGDGNRDIDFLGKAIIVRSTDPNDPNIVASTVIDCNGSSKNIHRGFYFHNYENPTSILSGITIINGYCRTWYNYKGKGGGIYCRWSSPTILNCTIRDCTATEDGGGICCESRSNSIIANCTITGNTAKSGGGVCCDYRSNALIDNCVISGNTAEGSSCGFGGGICSLHSDPIVTNCLIEHNRTDCYGAGIYSMGYDNVSPRFENCIIRFNRGCDGGGINCGRAVFSNCLITGNSVSWWGGGVLCGGDATFSNCTIAGNSAGHAGTGIMCRYSSPTITNCIVWYNMQSGVALPPIHVGTGDPEVTFSNVQFGWPAEGNIDVDPGFAFFDAYSFYNDFHLVRGSACIDAGTNTPVGGLAATDLEGTLRPLDGNSDGNAVADMGAYEHNREFPRLAVDSRELTFFGPAGWPNPFTEILLLRNAGGGVLSWRIDCESLWLGVNPSEGSSSGEVVQIELSVDTSSLVPGEYTATLLISDTQADGPSVEVVVTLTVGVQRHVPSEYATIQVAIDDCNDEGDAVIIAPGIYIGEGNRDLRIDEKTIIVSSINPNDPCVVAATVIDCEGTEADNHWGFHIFADYYDKVLLDGLTIINGYRNRGSGIYCFGMGSTIIRRCVLERNTGSSIFAVSRNALIFECKLVDNTSNSGGAGIYCTDAKIRRCHINRNHAKWGGGIRCHGSPEIENSIISGNSADVYGGGIYAVNSKPTLTNVTIVGNRANALGGGIMCRRECATILSNCILQGNMAEDGNQIALTEYRNEAFASNMSINYCDVQGGQEQVYIEPNNFIIWGHGSFDDDPCFVEPGYWEPNGTPTDVNDDFWVEGDYHLLKDSPCIDGGAPNYVAGPNETDLDGNPRVVDGDNDGNSVVDMGAYEYRPPAPAELILDLADVEQFRGEAECSAAGAGG
ncbi:MAG: right-handed parallel beta-helix repeat-containing protein [Planctomycetota bacterium]|jgi:parallel beta-helix repeat protein